MAEMLRLSPGYTLKYVAENTFTGPVDSSGSVKLFIKLQIN